MVTAIQFINFRVLRDATLPLGRVTVLLGPNGSGKSTVLAALDAFKAGPKPAYDDVVSVGVANPTAGATPATRAEVRLHRDDGGYDNMVWYHGFPPGPTDQTGTPNSGRQTNLEIASFALDPDRIAAPVELTKAIAPDRDGFGIARTLTNLQDRFPERFDALNADLRRWLPEFDRVLLDTPATGQRSFMLRTLKGRHAIPARNLSQGTLLAVAMLSIAHLPNVPQILALEEPDRGIHPRLLRDVQDAVYRLAFPQNHGDDRAPVQVILTTHSPYMVDLFRDHPEEIVIVKKQGLSATFEPLSKQPNIDEILRDAHLGEAWYSGVLGGVPAGI